MKTDSEVKIAWVLCHLLEEANDQLWNRYEKEFMRLVAEDEEQEVRAEERLNEMDPDSPSEPDP
jgi:hypothetical protein